MNLATHPRANRSSNETKKRSAMAKIQKSVFIPDRLVKYVEAHERVSGTHISRVVTAALLKYFFDSHDSPEREWMRYAMAVEKGETLPEDIIVERTERRVDKLKASHEGPADSHQVKQWDKMLANANVMAKGFKGLLWEQEHEEESS